MGNRVMALNNQNTSKLKLNKLLKYKSPKSRNNPKNFQKT